MSKTIACVCFSFVSLFLISIFVRDVAAQDGSPGGWLLRGVDAESYSAGVEKKDVHSGRGCGYIENVLDPMIVRPSRGEGTLMQAVKADQYRGKRLCLSAYLKGERIKGDAMLWMRVDGKYAPLAFSFGRDKMIKGNSEWKRTEIVIDIPESAMGLAFGVMLNGRGRAPIDDVKFDVVERTVPTTKVISGGLSMSKEIDLPAYNSSVQNLNFEK